MDNSSNYVSTFKIYFLELVIVVDSPLQKHKKTFFKYQSGTLVGRLINLFSTLLVSETSLILCIAGLYLKKNKNIIVLFFRGIHSTDLQFGKVSLPREVISHLCYLFPWRNDD